MELNGAGHPVIEGNLAAKFADDFPDRGERDVTNGEGLATLRKLGRNAGFAARAGTPGDREVDFAVEVSGNAQKGWARHLLARTERPRPQTGGRLGDARGRKFGPAGDGADGGE